MNFEQLFNSIIAEAMNDPQELIPTHELPSARVIVSRIEELEVDLKTTRATIRIMDQTQDYMKDRITELENTLRALATAVLSQHKLSIEVLLKEADEVLDSSKN